MQTYLAWRSSLLDLVEEDQSIDWKDAEQLRFASMLITEALAPTNVLMGNPAAIKHAFDSAGTSLMRGMHNFFEDVINNRGMPSQVDKRPFEVGRNLGVTPGAVIYRGDLCEVIQYEPRAKKVFARPLLMIPPQINKFYIMDLAPKRSFIEYALDHGVQVFAISWRNPTAALRDKSLDDYVEECEKAMAIACEVSGSPNCNVLGICAGGITMSLTLGHLAAIKAKRVNAGTLLVTMLRYQPAPDDRDVCDRGNRRRCDRALAKEGRARGRGHGAGVRVAASQRPGVELLDQQLPDGRAAARVRHPVLEQRLDQSSSRAA